MYPLPGISDAKVIFLLRQIVKCIAYISITIHPGTIRHTVIISSRRLTVGFIFLLVACFVITTVDHYLKAVFPVVAHFPFNTFHMYSRNILVLHHTFFFRYGCLNIIVDKAEKSVDLIIERMTVSRIPVTKKAQVYIIAAFGMKGEIGIDGRSVSEQLTRQRKTHTMFIRNLSCQCIPKGIAQSQTASPITVGRMSFGILRTGYPGKIVLFDRGSIDIVFNKNSTLPSSVEKRLVVSQSEDMLGQYIVGRFKAFVDIITAFISGTVKQIVQTD